MDKLNAELFGISEAIEKKCGEIFINESEHFNFLCIFCGTILKDIEKFIKHFKIHHLGICKLKDSHKANKKSSSVSSAKVHGKASPETSNNELKIEFIAFDYVEAKEEPNTSLPLIENLDTQLESFLLDYNMIKEKGIDEGSEQSHSQKHNETKEKIESINSPKIHKVEAKVQENDSDKAKTRHTRSKIKTQKSSRTLVRRKKENKANILCNICDKSFHTEQLLKSHLKYDHVPKNPLFEGDSTEQKSSMDPFKCKYCERKFTSRKSRYQHECSHTGEKPYKCDICGKLYAVEYGLKIHLKVHKNERPFKCEICNADFNLRTNLTVHMRRHNNIKRYKCRYCEKAFVCNSPRIVHERIHTGEKPYQCTECGICLISASKLNAHKICHHTNEKEKPYKCQYCERPFSAKREKTEHERIHTGEKPFICEICSASFRTGRSLKNHKKNHSKKIDKISDGEHSTNTK